ncbi:MAG: hypothetical protein EXQ58_13685 [Acidobacteria bacterium]|nr:hypothetical protein [Acidobacteriota bacterium]
MSPGFTGCSGSVAISLPGSWNLNNRCATGGAISNEQIIRIQDIELNRAVYKFPLVATTFLPLSFFTGLFGINLGGLTGARSDAAFWLLPPPVRCFWRCPSSSRKGGGCYSSAGAVKLSTPQPSRRNP